ncbi:substrate-binding domain-containing protein [Alkalibacter rhizosphaerae]|uniref:Substrate-binding domain-containing protein n=1 Tax=Alkalibacter rhizosphaerae TaxID=2815577 RepID=A0A974XLD8_9FIRM|nr:substrate-binding domain-containing protein [Alkalibacter rhizosphaerae]QSX08101.1 substrate-binding domain-containing protein [Alkalibacter rhizosphaerae]
MKKFLAILLTVFMIFAFAVGCTNDNGGDQGDAGDNGDGGDNGQVEEPKELILVTTTSTYDSGLLDYLLPYFEEANNYDISVISLGTGAALEQGKNGDADVALVHAKPTELEMVAEGHFVDRIDVMYNDFVIVGPAEDPAGLKEAADVTAAMKAIADNEATFISRGDDSGTHKKELSLWEVAQITPEGDWYVSAGVGMGDTLTMANEELGYTMSDRATYLSMAEDLDIEIVFEGDENLFNQYGIMAVNPENWPDVDYEGAKLLIDFFGSEEGQELISEFKPYGDTLFFPNAQ